MRGPERSSFVVVKIAMQPVASVGEPTLLVAVEQTVWRGESPGDCRDWHEDLVRMHGFGCN